MIGRFAGCVQDYKIQTAERELIFVVKENRRLDLRAVVAGPRAGLRFGKAELRRVAQREEARQPRLIIDELDVIALRNDLSAGLFPQRYAAGVIAARVCEDDV